MPKTKILLVDDEPDILFLIGERIRRWGYKVIKAKDGKSALKAIEKESPDIVILDYLMPGMDGILTFREIRKIDKKIPVIIYTSHPKAEIIQLAQDMGVSAFIPKLSAFSDTQSALKTAIDMIEKKRDK